MTIFDNTFLENLKNAIIKCNINKSLISKLLNKVKNIENTSSNTENSTIKDNENNESSDISNALNHNNGIFNEENEETLQSSNENINEATKDLDTNLNNIKNESFSDIHNDLDTIYSNNKEIEQFLFSIIPLIDKYIQDEANKNIASNAEACLEKNSDQKQNVTQNESNFNETHLIENTLIISEIQGKVFLPYFITDLEEISKCNDNMTFDEIIEQKYTLPISNFKALSISRFREAFKLARNKEKKSFKFAFDLGLEVLFDYNLHPAIIAACRTLDELDIYLDCLDSGETDKFECFNIKFEIPPVLIKK